jgi:hypothetical protein
MAVYNGAVGGCRPDLGFHLEHERIIQFDVALVTVAVYRRNVPAGLKFHFNVSKNYTLR